MLKKPILIIFKPIYKKDGPSENLTKNSNSAKKKLRKTFITLRVKINYKQTTTYRSCRQIVDRFTTDRRGIQ